jgi:hypothetical protein
LKGEIQPSVMLVVTSTRWYTTQCVTPCSHTTRSGNLELPLLALVRSNHKKHPHPPPATHPLILEPERSKSQIKG